MNITDKLPPHSQESEQVLLGSLLRNNALFDEIRTSVSADDFYFDAHQKIFRIIEAKLGLNQTCDLVILFEELRKSRLSDDVGGGAYLAKLWEIAGVGANGAYCAGIVRDMSVRRRLIRLCTSIIDEITNSEEPAEQIVARFESDIFAVSNVATSNEPEFLPKIIDNVMDGLNKTDGDNTHKIIRTGMERLDLYLGGWKPGQLVVIAARPSVGKSALAQQFAMASARAGKISLVFSLEMSREEWGQRALAQGCQVPLNYLTGALRMEETQARKLWDGIGTARVPVWIDDRAGHTIDTISAVARRAVRKHKVELIAIDYLQLIEHEGHKGDSLATRVGNTSRKLKVLARNLNVPILCLSQLNRESEKRGDGKPQLSDLRDSGAIEQDADTCLMLWPQVLEAGAAPPPEQEIRICIEKQRNGPKGIVPTNYTRATLTFSDDVTPIM